ncbi:MAG: beta-1,6-N-acetylglucosaminyltransferase [Solirubrobacterales bacterium]
MAIVVFAHHKPDQLARLLSVLRHPQVRVYLHLDRQAQVEPFEHAFLEAGVSDVVMLRRYAHRWGSSGIVDATVEGLRRGIEDGCSYFLLISGQDFPLRPVSEIANFVEQAGSRSYVESSPLPMPCWRLGGRDRTDFYSYTILGRRATCIPRGEDTSILNWKGQVLNQLLRARSAFKPRRSFPAYARPYGGSNWLNLSRTAVEYVLRFMDERPDYRRYHEHTLIPSEVFFHSILAVPDFADRVEVVDDDLRFTIWPETSSHPRTLKTDDLPAMEGSGKLFGRKFDEEVDRTVLERLTERVTT